MFEAKKFTVNIAESGNINAQKEEFIRRKDKINTRIEQIVTAGPGIPGVEKLDGWLLPPGDRKGVIDTLDKIISRGNINKGCCMDYAQAFYITVDVYGKALADGMLPVLVDEDDIKKVAAISAFIPLNISDEEIDTSTEKSNSREIVEEVFSMYVKGRKRIQDLTSLLPQKHTSLDEDKLMDWLDWVDVELDGTKATEKMKGDEAFSCFLGVISAEEYRRMTIGDITGITIILSSVPIAEEGREIAAIELVDIFRSCRENV